MVSLSWPPDAAGSELSRSLLMPGKCLCLSVYNLFVVAVRRHEFGVSGFSAWRITDYAVASMDIRAK